MTHDGDETDALLERAGRGDDQARQRLLERHRSRLTRMVAVRMDRRLAARLDPSDVVQEALADAVRDLPDFLREPADGVLSLAAAVDLGSSAPTAPSPRQDRAAERRPRASSDACPLPDESANDLARRLVSSGTSPSGHLIREELRERVQATLDRMPPRDREVLVLRYLEMLTNAEIAEVLGITEGAVKVRHFRALERFRGLMDESPREDRP